MKNPFTQAIKLIENRLVRDEINASHTVRINGQEAGILPHGLYARFMVDALHTPKIYVMQALNLWVVFVQVLWHLIKFIPIYAFWVSLYGYLHHQKGFLSVYHGLAEGKYDVHQIQSFLETQAFVYVVFVIVIATILNKIHSVGILFGFKNEFKKYIEGEVLNYFEVNQHRFHLVEVRNNERKKQRIKDSLHKAINPHNFKVHRK